MAELPCDFNCEAVHLRRRLALLTTGEVVKLESFVDQFGDETDEPEEAIAAVGPMLDGTWIRVDLTKFGPAPAH